MDVPSPPTCGAGTSRRACPGQWPGNRYRGSADRQGSDVTRVHGYARVSILRGRAGWHLGDPTAAGTRRGFFRLRRRRSDRGPTSICTCRCTCTCKAYAAPENSDTHHGSVGHRPRMPRSRGVPREEVHDGPTGHRLVQRLGARSRARADDRRLAPATRRSCAEFPGPLPRLHPRWHRNPDRPMAMWTTQHRRSSGGVPRARHRQLVTKRSSRPASGTAEP